MNLVRIGSAAVVGVASGALGQMATKPLMAEHPQLTSWSAIAEALALVGGGVLQFVSPFTMPDVVDGIVDGGIALVARRASDYVIGKTKAPAASYAAQAAGYLASGMGARGQMSNISGLPHYSLT